MALPPSNIIIVNLTIVIVLYLTLALSLAHSNSTIDNDLNIMLHGKGAHKIHP